MRFTKYYIILIKSRDVLINLIVDHPKPVRGSHRTRRNARQDRQVFHANEWAPFRQVKFVVYRKSKQYNIIVHSYTSKISNIIENQFKINCVLLQYKSFK